MKQPRIIIEVRPRLQSCHIYYLPNWPSRGQQFSVDVQISAITIKSSQSEEVFTFDHLKLKPIVLNGLKADDSNIVTWRVQSSDSVNSCDVTDNSKFIPNVSCHQNVQIMCRACHSALLKKDVFFDRILPLPSSDFNSGDLFCHECCNGEFVDKLKVFPKNNDLLYSNYFFKINCDLLCGVKTFLSKDRVHCAQCQALLGSKESDDVSVKFWNCTVAFSCDDSIVTPEGDFISAVKSTVHDNLGPICKMVIKHKSVPPEYLLLCVMDQYLPLFISTDSSNKLITLNVMKLMYLHKIGSSEIVSKWEKDINTHTVDVAEVMFTEGFQYLEQCNKMFPIIFRQVNDMNISYLGI